MENLFTIILIGIVVYALYTIFNIYNLKRKAKELKSEYIEKGGLTEEQKENHKIQDLLKTIIANNDKEEKYRLLSDIYSNYLGNDDRKIKYFESELNKLAPEILKTNFNDKLFNIFLRVLGGFIFLALWGAFMLVTRTGSGLGPAISGMALGAFIVYNPWIKAWINPFGLKNSERFRSGKKLW